MLNPHLIFWTHLNYFIHLANYHLSSLSEHLKYVYLHDYWCESPWKSFKLEFLHIRLIKISFLFTLNVKWVTFKFKNKLFSNLTIHLVWVENNPISILNAPKFYTQYFVTDKEEVVLHLNFVNLNSIIAGLGIGSRIFTLNTPLTFTETQQYPSGSP